MPSSRTPLQRAPRAPANYSPAAAPDDDEEGATPAQQAAAPSPTGTTGGAIPQQGGEWWHAQAAPIQWHDDPQARTKQSMAETDRRLAAHFQEQNPFRTEFDKVATPESYYRHGLAQANEEHAYQQQQRRLAAVAQRQQAATDTAAYNSRVKADSEKTGKIVYTDPLTKRLTYKTDEQGRQIYNEVPRALSTHPKTGAPAWESRDRYGQRQYSPLPMQLSTDPMDEHGYYYNKDTDELVQGPHYTEMLKSNNPVIQRQGIALKRRMDGETAKTAIADAEGNLARISTDYKATQDKANTLTARADALRASGGDMREAKRMEDEAAALQETTKGHTEVALQKRMAEADLMVQKAKLTRDQYLYNRDEIGILGGRGKPHDSDNETRLKAAEDTYQNALKMRAGVNVLNKPAAVAGQPVEEPGAAGASNIGGVGADEFARRYGDGSTPTSPANLLKLYQRSKDIEATLGDKRTSANTQLRDSLRNEKTYIDQLASQRLAALPEDQQKRVIETSRDPTFWDTVKGGVKSLGEGAAQAGAQLMKDAAVVSQAVAPNVPLPLAQRVEMAKEGPVYKLGQFISDAAKETYSKGPHEEETTTQKAINSALEAAGGFAPLVASGPAAPATIGLQSVGADLENNYQAALARGMSPEKASDFATKRALAGGLAQAAIFEFLPPAFKGVIDKGIVDKVVGGGFKKFLANRAAQGVEGAALGTASAVAGNVAADRPLTEGVTEAGVGLGAMQALMPRGASARPLDEAATPSKNFPVTDKPAGGATVPATDAEFDAVIEQDTTLSPEEKAHIRELRSQSQPISTNGLEGTQTPAPGGTPRSAEDVAGIFERNIPQTGEETPIKSAADSADVLAKQTAADELAARMGVDRPASPAEASARTFEAELPQTLEPQGPTKAAPASADILRSAPQMERKGEARPDSAKEAARTFETSIPQTEEPAVINPADRSAERISRAEEAKAVESRGAENRFKGRKEAIDKTLTEEERLRQSPEGRDLLREQLKSGKSGLIPPEVQAALEKSDLTPAEKEHFAQLHGESEAQADDFELAPDEPVNIGPRDASVSTGNGTPTPKEAEMLAEQKRLIDEHNAKQNPPEPSRTLAREPTSWIIRDKDGKAVKETYDKAEADAATKDGYDVVPSLQHLQELNQDTPARAAAATKPSTKESRTREVKAKREEASTPPPDKGVIARTTPKPRADVDNGTRYTEWRVRKITNDDLQANDHLRSKSSAGEYVVERRTNRTEGDKVEPGAWEIQDSGATKKAAIEAAWEPQMGQAESLDSTHQSLVDAENARRGEEKSKVDAENKRLAENRAKQGEYAESVRSTKLPKGEQKEITLRWNSKEGTPVEKKVAATVYGDWAIWKDDSSKQSKYNVTHVPSGKKAQGKPTIGEAKEVVQAFIHSGIDVSSPELASDQGAIKKLAQAMQGMNEANPAPDWLKGKTVEEPPTPKSPTAELRANNAGADLPPISGMSREAKRAELDASGIKTYNGKPLDDANPAEISNAVGKLRRGELGPEGEKPGKLDQAISRLDAEIKKYSGEGKSKMDPRSEKGSSDLHTAAYVSALRVARVILKAGRSVAEAVETAIKRYRALNPKHTAEELGLAEKDVRAALAEPPKPAGKSETTGIAHRVSESAGIAAERGEGISAKKSTEEGRKKYTAEKALDSIRQFEGDPQKRVSEEAFQLAKAHKEALAKITNAAVDEHGYDSSQAKAAREAEAKWIERIKPLQTAWHASGQAQQGETEIDTGTFHGLARAFRESTGRDFDKKEADTARSVAGRVKKATEEADAAQEKLFKTVDTGAKATKETVASAEKKVQSRKPGSKWTAEEARALWHLAKTNYLEKGIDNPHDIRAGLATDYGLTPEDVHNGLATPKGARVITDDMYSKMAKKRALVAAAKRWVAEAKYPGYDKFFRGVPSAFFNLATLGHGTVWTITHSPSQYFLPKASAQHFRDLGRSFKLMGLHEAKVFGGSGMGGYHERMMADLERDPNFIKAKRAGLANDPEAGIDDYQNPGVVKMFKELGMMGNRGFDGLKLFRQFRFNQEWEAMPESLRTKEGAEILADRINKATGVVTKPRKWSIANAPGGLLFAPKLEASRWAFLYGDPLHDTKVMAQALLDPSRVTPEQVHAAKREMRQKLTMVGAYLSALGINQALLSATDSDQEINFSEPLSGDWLSFKGFGHEIGIASGLVGSVRFLKNLAHDLFEERSKYEQMQHPTRYGQAFERGGEYLRGKESPSAKIATDLITGSDAIGRTLPYSREKLSAKAKRFGYTEPYTYAEYAAKNLLPIPFEEAANEIFKQQGVNEEDAEKWMRALVVAASAATTGARIHPEKPEYKGKH